MNNTKSTVQTNLPVFMTVDEFAAQIGVSRRKAFQLIAERAIPVVRLGARCTRINWPDALQALKSLTVEAR